MANFSFELDSFQITQTRSYHLDTDYVACTLAVNPQNGTANTYSSTRYMGDLNNGVFALNISFPDVVVNEGDIVVFNYLIVNSGHNVALAVAEATVESVSRQLAAGNASILPVEVGVSALETLASWLQAQLSPILKSQCDGAVAAEQSILRYDDLLSRTAGGPFPLSTHHAGTNSASGCGKNSAYIVNWNTLERGNPANISVPYVIGDPLTTAESALKDLGLSAGLPAKIPSRPTVSDQNPKVGNIVRTGSQVALTLVAASTN